jgi:uncharacterized protein (TIGR03435 family)
MRVGYLFVLAIAVITIPVLCQSPSGVRPSFEVATIKPGDPGQRGSMIQIQPGGRLVVSHVPFRTLLTVAYRVRDFQISGGPAWMTNDFWDIEARSEAGSVLPPTGFPDPNKPDPMAVRLQSLLEDRFQLKFHHESKELPVYELSISKSGLKMKPSEDQTFRLPEPGAPPPQPGGPMPRGATRIGRGSLDANAVPISSLVMTLSMQLGRTVIDKTGLQGFYDAKLQWTPDNIPQGGSAGPGGPEAAPPIDPNGPSIFTAIQEQLGLKLEATKGPVDVIVIDSVQKPSEN